MRATKLVCTLGPATASLVPELVAAGMDVGRINCSHGTREEHDRLLASVREAADRAGRPVGVLADLSGPKVRLREVAGGAVELRTGERFVLRAGLAGPGDETGASTSHPGLAADLEPGDRVLLSDGDVELRVESSAGDVVTEVVRGGRARSRAGVNVPAARLGLPAIGEKDRADAAWALSAGVDLVAQSFVRRAEDVTELGELLGTDGPRIVAKVETRAAVEDAARILEVADALMVARGDLGVEASPEEIPVLQKELVSSARAAGVPVVVATQMLESMVDVPQPTRAEAGDVANAVFEGADAILLSAETAIGSHPVEAAATAVRIATVAETRGARFLPAPAERGAPAPSDAHAVARAAADIAREGGAVAVACFTRTGRTAALLSSAGPRVPILALSPEPRVVRRLTLHRGIVPRGCVVPGSTDQMLDVMDRLLRQAGLAGPGDPAVLVASTPFGLARTNLLKVHRLAG
ncbi:MAG: pyruvate kinase [Actinomycetota bacterium]